MIYDWVALNRGIIYDHEVGKGMGSWSGALSSRAEPPGSVVQDCCAQSL